MSAAAAANDDFYCNIFINILYVYVRVCYAAAGHMQVRRRIGAEICSVIICTRTGGVLCVCVNIIEFTCRII